MDTETLAANLRQAIAGCGDYHIERWGRELADRAEELQRVVDARQTQHNAARAAVMERRDTESATDETAREAAIQAENVWLREQLLDILRGAGCRDENALCILDMEDESFTSPATYVLDALDNLRATAPTQAEKVWLRDQWARRIKNENAWLREEWLRLLDSMGREDAHRILDMDDEGADAPSTVVLDELWKQRVTTTALCAEVAKMEPEPAKEPEPKPVRACESCKWFDRDEPCNSYDVGWDGECHRYPEPSSHDDADWCGEWEER